MNVFREFSFSESELHPTLHPLQLIIDKEEIPPELFPLGVHCLFLVFPSLLMCSVILAGQK